MYKKFLIALIFIIPMSINAQTVSSFDMGNITLRKSKTSNYYVVNLQKALNTSFVLKPTSPSGLIPCDP